MFNFTAKVKCAHSGCSVPIAANPKRKLCSLHYQQYRDEAAKKARKNIARSLPPAPAPAPVPEPQPLPQPETTGHVVRRGHRRQIELQKELLKQKIARRAKHNSEEV